MSSNLLDIQKHLHEVGRELAEDCQSMNVWMRSSTGVTGVNIGSPFHFAGERTEVREISLGPETCLWIKASENLRRNQTVRSPKTQRTLLLHSNIQGHKILPVSNVKSAFNQRGLRPGDVA